MAKTYNLEHIATAASHFKYGLRKMLDGNGVIFAIEIHVYPSELVIVSWNKDGPRAMGRDIESIRIGLSAICAIEKHVDQMLPGTWRRGTLTATRIDEYVMSNGNESPRCYVQIRKEHRNSDLLAVKELAEHLLERESAKESKQ